MLPFAINMRILVKIGGAALERAAARAELATALAGARGAGHELVVVHGGGNQIRALSARLSIDDRYVDGLRVTDAETAEVVLAVVAGAVGKTLAASLAEAGLDAVSLCGADGRLYDVERHPTRELGYVGRVSGVRSGLLEALLAAGMVPLVACVAPLAPEAEGPRDHLYNVNADDVALALARALAVDALIFLTDVPAVLDARGARIASLDELQAVALTAEGVVRGGMLPKVRAGLDAAAALPGALIKIAPAGGRDALLAALRADVGTTFAGSAARV